MALVSAVYWAAFSRAGLPQLMAALQVISVKDFALACCVCALALGVRFLRWQAILCRLGHRPPWGFSLRVYVAGIALTWTPGKLGETLRSVLLLPAGVPWHHSIGAFIADRAADVVGVALLGAAAAVAANTRLPLLELIAGLTLAGSLLLAHALRQDWVPRLPRRFQRWQDLALQPARAWACAWRLAGVAGYASAAVIAYGVQAAVFASFATSVAPHLDGAACIAWFALAVFVGAASLMPAGLGAMEGALVWQLTAQQVAWPEALAITFATRAASLGIPSLLGFCMLLSFARAETALRHNHEPRLHDACE